MLCAGKRAVAKKNAKMVVCSMTRRKRRKRENVVMRVFVGDVNQKLLYKGVKRKNVKGRSAREEIRARKERNRECVVTEFRFRFRVGEAIFPPQTEWNGYLGQGSPGVCSLYGGSEVSF